MSSTLFTSSLTIVTSALISLGLLFRLRKDHSLVGRPFFWHWAVGFFFFGFAHLPTLAVNLVPILEKTLSYQTLVFYLTFAFFSALIANLLFYRGTALLVTGKPFWLNTLPLIIFLSLTVTIPSLFFIFNLPAPIVVSVFMFGLVVPVDLFLILTFAWFYFSAHCFEDRRRRFTPLVISVAWILILWRDVAIWWLLWNFPADFWILRLASLGQWYLIRAFSHVIILIGLIFLGRCLPYLKTRYALERME